MTRQYFYFQNIESSIHPPVLLSIQPSNHSIFYLSIYPFMHSFFCPFSHRSIHLATDPSIFHRSIYSATYPSIHSFIHAFICAFISQSTNHQSINPLIIPPFIHPTNKLNKTPSSYRPYTTGCKINATRVKPDIR